MIDFDADLAECFDSDVFARPAVYQGRTVNVILDEFTDQVLEERWGGTVGRITSPGIIAKQFVMTYRTSDLPDLRVDSTISIAGVNYKVGKERMQDQDGLVSHARLAKVT